MQGELSGRMAKELGAKRDTATSVFWGWRTILRVAAPPLPSTMMFIARLSFNPLADHWIQGWAPQSALSQSFDQTTHICVVAMRFEWHALLPSPCCVGISP